ncbi:hypothetical protein OEA41_006463 [Lepraria neglecta]|uniref:NAD(P)-binding protein n=1 Tax=Lepraria neglecta TaxID=209136 RepID=A0AAD9Z7Z5_9LECA|nr:hypothetical protein OEA41_006463 [Lepraria neglecta]
MKPPLPSATPTWHNDTYPSISPLRPELRVSGKTIIITGAVSPSSSQQSRLSKDPNTTPLTPLHLKGSGIGRETASTFATAGAHRIILLGRNEATLAETKAQLPPTSAICSIQAVSITDEKALNDVAAGVGTWGILVCNAAFLSSPAAVAETHVDDWWQSFEVGSLSPSSPR